MSEHWELVRLTDVASRLTTKNCQALSRVLTVAAGYGLVDQQTFFTKKVASEDVSNYWVVEPNDLVYNKSTSKGAPYGVVARHLDDRPGVVTPLYIVFRAIPLRTSPEFLELACNSSAFFDSLSGTLREGARSHGLLNVRLQEFFSATFPLPPIAEQRRIVDLIGALDAQMTSGRDVVTSATALLDSLLSGHTAAATGQQRRIADCCTHVVGGVWGEEPGVGDVDIAALGPRIYTPGTPGFSVEGSPIRSFSFRQVDNRLVRAGDIVLERSGGSPDQPVGRVVIASGEEGTCVPTDFQRLLRPDPDVVLPRYLFWRLWCDWRAGVTLGYSRRTTGITNLSVPNYLDRLLTLPQRTEQESIVMAADSVAEVIAATAQCITGLARLRTSLLTGLLSGAVAIPESYDDLLVAV